MKDEFENQTEAEESTEAGKDVNELENGSADAVRSQNEEKNGADLSDDGESKKPWFLTPSVTVEKDYNPYKSDESVFEETFKKYPGAFKGATRLRFETPEMFYYRHRDEYNFARAEAKKGVKNCALYVSLVLFFYLALTNFFSFVFGGFFSEELTEVILTAIQFLAIAPTVLIVANIGLKHKVGTLLKKPQVSGFYIFKWCVIAIGTTYTVNMISVLLMYVLNMFGIYVNDLSQALPESPGMLVTYFLSVVIGAPIFEELLFRGVILTHLKKYGCWFSIITSGVIFGLIHQNYHQIFFATALGIIFGYIDVKSGSVIPSVIAHMSVNLYSFIMTFFLYFTNYNETLADPSLKLDGPFAVLMVCGIFDVLLYALMVVATLLLAYEIIKNRDEFDLPKGDSFLTEKEKHSAFFTHPAMIAFLALIAVTVFFVSFFDLSAFTQSVLAVSG